MGNGSLRMSSDRQDVNGLTIRSLLMAEITGVGDGSYDFRAGRLCNSREWFAGLYWARSFDSVDGGFLSPSHILLRYVSLHQELSMAFGILKASLTFDLLIGI